MINIDKYAYSSKLKNINPAEKMFFALITLCVCLWANNFIVSMLIISIMTFLITKVGRTKIGVFIKLMMVPIAFFNNWYPNNCCELFIKTRGIFSII